MKLIFITSYTFPSTRAEPYYVKSMAEAFVEVLSTDFTLVIRGRVPDDMKKLNACSVLMPERFRILRYFMWFPFFVVRKRMYRREVVFMSNDPYLLSIFIVWRKILGFAFRYRICADWHQLFNDWRDAFIAHNSEYHIATTKKLQGLISSKCAIDPSTICVAYGGIDLSFFAGKLDTPKNTFREKLQLPQDAFLVGYMGGFKAVGLEKGLNTMIQALPHLNERIMMVFVGGSSVDIAEYTQRAKDMHLEHRCVFIKKQLFDRVTEYELAMDVLVIPYPDKPHFRDYGFPLKVWEYMASGRPIVYSNLAIIREVLEGRGVVFMPGDTQDLARAVTEVYTNREIEDARAYKNREYVQTYTWDVRIATILTFITGNTTS